MTTTSRYGKTSQKKNCSGSGLNDVKPTAIIVPIVTGTALTDRSAAVTARHGRQAHVAAHQMQIVARQQRDVSRAQRDDIPVRAVDPDTKVALDDVVIQDQVGCWPEIGRAMLRRDARRQAPRREEIGVQEHAAGQMRHP